jgi:hypothetical protein
MPLSQKIQKKKKKPKKGKEIKYVMRAFWKEKKRSK